MSFIWYNKIENVLNKFTKFKVFVSLKNIIYPILTYLNFYEQNFKGLPRKL